MKPEWNLTGKDRTPLELRKIRGVSGQPSLTMLVDAFSRKVLDIDLSYDDENTSEADASNHSAGPGTDDSTAKP